MLHDIKLQIIKYRKCSAACSQGGDTTIISISKWHSEEFQTMENIRFADLML